jgi:translation initiation factor 1 (eIF-1/SUI1)
MQIKFQNENISLMHNSNYSLAISFLKNKQTEIDLKEAQRFFAQKFSCGASVTGEDEIIIQGDFTDDIIEVIQEKWPEVSAWDTCAQRSKLLPFFLLDS